VEVVDKRASLVLTPISAAMYSPPLHVALLFVVDLTEPDSLCRVYAHYLETAQVVRSSFAGMPKLFVGNKSDRAVNDTIRSDCCQLAHALGIPYVETSTINGAGVAFLLPYLVNELEQRLCIPRLQSLMSAKQQARPLPSATSLTHVVSAPTASTATVARQDEDPKNESVVQTRATS